jgi:ribose 5-phosphate isomerase B
VRIVVGADHAGYALKQVLAARLGDLGHTVTDLGTDSEEPVDYPEFGAAVGRAVAGGVAELGVCVCGTGIGVGMAANKVPKVRAAVVHDVTTARLARTHNHANVLCLGSRVIGEQVAKDALDAFLEAQPAGGRHDRRVAELGGLDAPGAMGAAS